MHFVFNSCRHIGDLFARASARGRRVGRTALVLMARASLAVFSRIDARDVSLWLGLVAFWYGASLWWLPLAYMGPGAVLIWIALPRPPRREIHVRDSIAEGR